jgi:hypothetical protein
LLKMGLVMARPSLCRDNDVINEHDTDGVLAKMVMAS